MTRHHFVEKLKQIALLEITQWDEFQNLRLWLLVIDAIKASPVDRLHFIEGIERALERLCIKTWEEVTLVVASILFNEERSRDRDAGILEGR